MKAQSPSKPADIPGLQSVFLDSLPPVMGGTFAGDVHLHHPSKPMYWGLTASPFRDHIAYLFTRHSFSRIEYRVRSDEKSYLAFARHASILGEEYQLPSPYPCCVGGPNTEAMYVSLRAWDKSNREVLVPPEAPFNPDRSQTMHHDS